MKPVAVIDMDGVLADFEKKWLLVSTRLHGVEPKRISDDYNFSRRYNVGREHVDKVFQNMEWSKIPFFAHAKNVIDALKDDFHIHICSAADEVNFHCRKKALGMAGVYFDTLTLVGLGQSKLNHYVGAYMVIDDHEKHIQEALSVGVPHVFMVNQGYACMSVPKDAVEIQSIEDVLNFGCVTSPNQNHDMPGSSFP